MFLNAYDSAKLIDIYRNRHNINASAGLNDPAVAMGISDLVYESNVTHKEPNSIDPELAMAWAAGLDDGLLGSNAPAMDRVRILSNIIYDLSLAYDLCCPLLIIEFIAIHFLYLDLHICRILILESQPYMCSYETC